jgi:hypothetical protein
MRKIMLLVLGSMALTIGAQELTESSKEQLGLALGLPDPTSRLQALELALADIGIEPIISETNESTGLWEMKVEIDPVTDEKKFIFVLEADAGRSRYQKGVYLIIRHSGERTEAFVNWGDYLGSEVQVTERVGSGEPLTRLWGLSTDKTASFYPSGDLAFVQSLLEEDSLVLRTTPYNSNPVTAVFDIRGLKNVAEQYDNELGWW